MTPRPRPYGLPGPLALSRTAPVDPNADEQDALAPDAVIEAIADAVDGMAKAKRGDAEAVAEKVHLTVRRALKRIRGKKPLTEVHVVRV